MSNLWFQFKQFTVNQEKSAMKVCTDACLFGAYIASKEKDTGNDKTNILDIGTGTGLLSLMIAQKVKGNIEAVEIDERAYEQALANFKNSSWKSRLAVLHADITEVELSKKYNIIISNPPFFHKSLKSSNNQKNLAKHTTSLPFTALAAVVYSYLTDNGLFYILLPIEEFEVFENIAIKNKLALVKKADIRPTASSRYFRTIGVFTNAAVHESTAELLTIKEDNNEYTKEFVRLLKDYYLYL